MSKTESHDMGGGIIRLLAGNPSPMTGTGTNSYLVHGPDGALLIDPGPALPSHRDAILADLGDRPLMGILVTHAHIDHTELCPEMASATRAPVYAFGPANAGRSRLMQRLMTEGLAGGGEGVDSQFAPDHCLVDGQSLQLAGLRIDVLHTPGHMSGHLCFALGDRLFSGDHVMGWSSSIVSPPDGDMSGYMASLERLSARKWQDFLPGHGATITAPAARMLELTAHRKAREKAILAALQNGPATAQSLATAIYIDTPAALLPAAERNILAHLIDLYDKKRIEPVGLLTAGAKFKFR